MSLIVLEAFNDVLEKRFAYQALLERGGELGQNPKLSKN